MGKGGSNLEEQKKEFAYWYFVLRDPNLAAQKAGVEKGEMCIRDRKYYVYVAKNNGSTSDKTNEVWVSGKYENTAFEYVNFDWTNNANAVSYTHLDVYKRQVRRWSGRG